MLRLHSKFKACLSFIRLYRREREKREVWGRREREGEGEIFCLSVLEFGSLSAYWFGPTAKRYKVVGSRDSTNPLTSLVRKQYGKEQRLDRVPSGLPLSPPLKTSTPPSNATLVQLCRKPTLAQETTNNDWKPGTFCMTCRQFNILKSLFSPHFWYSHRKGRMYTSGQFQGLPEMYELFTSWVLMNLPLEFPACKRASL